ncbi:MAG: DUF2752 domain-containing protein, partial [Thermoanaerobaculia bacterium]|nr:DUF2752 domain-containing protein [Thermoanaerobaculia bacterium]
ADQISLLVAGAIVVGTLAAPAIDAAGLLPEKTVCLSQRLAGIECPSCGLTRSVVALGQGDLQRSLGLNWLAPSLFALALLHVAARVGKLLRPSVRLRTFDLATLATIILLYLVRAIQIWT